MIASRTIGWIVLLLVVALLGLLFAQGPYEGKSRERAEVFRDGAAKWVRIFGRRVSPPDDGLVRRSGHQLDSDESECTYPGRGRSDQMIRTRFAGYLLEHPCTARGRGHWSTTHSPDGALQSTRYNLRLVLLIDKERTSIWRPSGIDFSPDFTAFAHLKNYPAGWSVENHSMFEDAELVHQIPDRGIEVYKTHFGIIHAKISYQAADGLQSAILSCHSSTAEKVIELLQYGEARGAHCTRLRWSLNPDITVMVQQFRKENAPEIEALFELLDTQLREMIVPEQSVSIPVPESSGIAPPGIGPIEPSSANSGDIPYTPQG